MFAATLMHFALAAARGAVLFAATLIVLRAMSDRSAAARHAVLRIALATQLLLLAMPAALPWRSFALSLPTFLERAGAPAASIGADPSTIASVTGPIAGPLVALWLVVAGAMLTRLLLGVVQQRRVAATARHVADPVALDVIAAIARDMQLARVPSLVVSNTIQGPATWGVARHTIAVPATLAQWPVERWRVVLRHELAHVARRDAATQIIARIAAALFWFDPLVWICARREHVERERACDDAVVCSGVLASDYVQHVVAIVRDQRGAPTPGLALGASRGALETRMLDALDARRARKAVRAQTSGARAAIAALVVAASLASLQPASAHTVGHGAEELVGLRIDTPGPCRGSVVLHQCAVLDSAGNVEQLFRVVRDSRTPHGRIVASVRSALHVSDPR